jgi:DNA-binding GntR family transcriptional regulator
MIAVKTWQEAAVEQLREAIIRGAYQPGQRLKQQELARTLGCSPVPVREAFIVWRPRGSS